MIKSQLYYWVTCDYRNCTAEANEGEYSAFSDASGAVEEAECSEWLSTADGHHFCPAHTVWDEGCDEPAPAPETFAWELDSLRRRSEASAHRQLENVGQSLDREFHLETSGWSANFCQRLDGSLLSIHAAACRAWQPGITGKQIHNLVKGGI